jgi:hypothetical protein
MDKGGSVPNVLPNKKEIIISTWSRSQIADASARRHMTPIWFYLAIASLFVYFLLAYRSNDLLNHGFFSTLVLASGCASSLSVHPYEQYFLYAALVSAILWVVSWFRKTKV